MSNANFPRIHAAVVNHNTSPFCELMLRSLYSTQPGLPNFSLRVYDNGSNDDSRGLRAYARQVGVPVLPSGFSLETSNNSHGDVMRSFVLANPDCDYYLFLDADVVFTQPDTLGRMLRELQAAPDAFGAGPRMSWDGVNPYNERDLSPEVYQTRLHPACALVRNTPVFRSVVDEVGLFCVKYLWGNHEEYLDTFKLMTKVMKTHGLRHLITSPIVIHFFSTSYDWDEASLKARKRQHCETLLAHYRALEDNA